MSRFFTAALTWAFAAILPSLCPAQALPQDPRLVSGVLENGARYMVVRIAAPADPQVPLVQQPQPGPGMVWLHVRAGSVQETDAQRGLAHFLEHLAFDGSEHFKPDAVAPFLATLGMNSGPDMNAHTGFEETVYRLTLKEGTPETLARALSFLADIPAGLSLLPDQIEKERALVLGEKQKGLGVRQRVQDIMWQQIAPGSAFSGRLPTGTEETITSITQHDIKDYYSKWYVPAAMTIMVVADIEPQAALEQIKKSLGALEKRPLPTLPDLSIKPQAAPRAIVATDPELKDTQVYIMRVDPSRGPTTTEDRFRDKVLDSLAVGAFNRRLESKVASGAVKFSRGQTFTFDAMSTMQLSGMLGISDAGAWRETLGSMGVELQRALLHGFHPGEIEDTKKQIVRQTEEAHKNEASMQAKDIMGQLNSAVGSGDAFLSIQQQLDLLNKVAPKIEPAQVSERFKALFGSSGMTFIVAAPAGPGLPPEADLLRAGAESLAVKPAPEGETARPTALLAEKPAPGKVAQEETHSATSVWSGWLSNGVRIHHKMMDAPKDQVTVGISLAGGVLAETGANRGITELATVAWQRPATSKMSSADVRELLQGKKVGIDGGPGTDNVLLTVNAVPADLEAGMQLAYLLLTDPLIEAPGVEQWKKKQADLIAERKAKPEGVFGDAMIETMFPKDEPRVRPLEKEDIARLDREMAQAWLKGLIAASPIEVSVVGDISRDKAVELVSTYIGSLPARERISDKTFAPQRTVKRPVGPLKAERRTGAETPQAFVMSGFYGTDARNTLDTRLLGVAAQVLTARMTTSLRDQEHLVFGIRAISQPAEELPGFGLFATFAPCDPAKADLLADKIEQAYKELAASGPTDAEMDTARKEVIADVQEQVKDPRSWSALLSLMTYRARNLDILADPAAAYNALTAAQVKECFERYFKDEGKMRVLVKPEAAASEPAGPQAPKPAK